MLGQSPADQIIFHENCLYPGINSEQRSFGRGGVRSRRVEDEMFAKKYENVFAKLFRRSLLLWLGDEIRDCLLKAQPN